MNENKQKYNFIKCIDYILKKNGFNLYISKNRFLIDKLMIIGTPYNILEILKISYKKAENLISRFNIAIMNNDVYVIEHLDNKTDRIWCAENKKYVNKDISDFDEEFISIENINDNCLKLLSIKSYIYNYLQIIKDNILNIVKIYFISILSSLLIFINSALFETIIDTLIPYKNIELLFETILIILFISAMIFMIDKIKNKCIKKFLKQGKYRSFFTISEIIATLILLIPICMFNKEIFYFISLSISSLVLTNYIVYSFKNIINLNINPVYKINLYMIFSMVFTITLIFLNTVIFINNSINKGSILSNLILYIYLLYIFSKTCTFFEEFHKDYQKISNNFYKKQLCKVHDQISELNINDITLVELKNNKRIKMENGTFNLFIGTANIGKTYLSYCIRGTAHNSDYCIYYNGINIKEFEKNFLKSKCRIIGNDYYKKGLSAYNYIFNNKLIEKNCRTYILKKMGLNRLLQIEEQNKEIKNYEITDTERLLLIVSKYMLINTKILIFDGILSSFDKLTVDIIINMISEMKVIGISFERNETNKERYDQIYYLNDLYKEDIYD